MKKVIVSLIAVLLVGIVFSSSVPDTACIAHAKTNQSINLMNRYKKLVRKCKEKYKYDGSQAEMNHNAYNEYQTWDKELNFVYFKIYKSLSASSKKVLKKSQLAWISKKEKAAKAAAAEWEGGSGETTAYYGSLIVSTKKRVRWLINHYA